MKKYLAIVFIIVSATSTFGASPKSAPPKKTPSMIAIHVGPAHPLFAEEPYPDIEFLYLPDYQVEIARGKKDFFGGKASLIAGEGLIADWFAAKAFMAFPNYKSLLFDKNQVCVFDGWLGVNGKSASDQKYKMQNVSINNAGKKTLNASLDNYVQKLKTLKVNPKKDLLKDKDYVGGRIFDIRVVDFENKTIHLPDMVMEAGPTLLFFFTIPPDATAAEVANFTLVLDQIELDFFGYLVNKSHNDNIKN